MPINLFMQNNKNLMQESKKKHDARVFLNETLISTTQDVTTYIATKTGTKVILMKTNSFKSSLKPILMNPEINNDPNILKVEDIFQENQSTVVVYKQDGFMPLEIFFKKNFDEKLFLFVILKIIEILIKGRITKMMEMIDLWNIWINEEGELRICWFSTILKNLRVFDNEVYKMNVSTLEDINKLISLNSKHCRKRLYNFPNNSDDKIQYVNMFHHQDKSIVFQDAVTKAGKRKYGCKKVCLEKSELQEVSEKTKTVINLEIVKKLILRMLLYKTSLEEKDLEAQLTRFTEVLKGSTISDFSLHFLSDSSLHLLRSLFVEHVDAEELLMTLRDQLDLSKVKNLCSGVTKEFTRVECQSEQHSAREIFAKNGFNMEEYSTIAYKKGRFQVYEAVPSPSDKKKEYVNDLLRIVDIQNRQIEMIYRTMKERNSINKLEDDQLESLSKEINNILQKITKEE